METCSYFQQARNPSVYFDPSAGWRNDAGKNFKQGRLAGAVPADNAYAFSLVYFKAHIIKRPEVLFGRSLRSCDHFFAKRIHGARKSFIAVLFFVLNDIFFSDV